MFYLSNFNVHRSLSIDRCSARTHLDRSMKKEFGEARWIDDQPQVLVCMAEVNVPFFQGLSEKKSTITHAQKSRLLIWDAHHVQRKHERERSKKASFAADSKKKNR